MIMLIVPANDVLSVQAKVSPNDIDELSPNPPVLLRFSAFNMRTTPELNGTVNWLGADQIENKQTGTSYYLVRISVPASELARLEGSQGHSWNAGRGLHSNRESDRAVLSAEAALRPADAGLPGRVDPGEHGAEGIFFGTTKTSSTITISHVIRPIFRGEAHEQEITKPQQHAVVQSPRKLPQNQKSNSS